MKIEETSDKNSWNKFLFDNDGSFLQSVEWSDFQERNSRKIWLLKIEEGGERLAQLLLIKEIFLKDKNFLYIPFGPTFRNDLLLDIKKSVLSLILKTVGEIAKSENSVFLKIEPSSFLPSGRDFLLKPALKRIQPQKTLILDLRKPEEEIFNNFHLKTRYHIRLAEKKGVVVSWMNKNNSNLESDVDIFYNILTRTADRQDFGIYPKDYYRKFLDVYTNDFKTDLFLAKYQNEFIAANIVVFFGKRATYLHGGLDYQYRSLRAPFILHWQQIREAKKRGYTEYDFWGIDEKKWPGLTYFKKNFGGREFTYPLGIDLIFNGFWYLLYKVLRTLK